MPKHADGPPSGRMGFGFEAAKEAGAPWVPQRPIHKINEEVRARRAAKADRANELHRLLTDHPNLKERAWQLHNWRWPADAILSKLRDEARERAWRREVLAKSKKR